MNWHFGKWLMPEKNGHQRSEKDWNQTAVETVKVSTVVFLLN